MKKNKKMLNSNCRSVVTKHFKDQKHKQVKNKLPINEA